MMFSVSSGSMLSLLVPLNSLLDAQLVFGTSSRVVHLRAKELFAKQMFAKEIFAKEMFAKEIFATQLIHSKCTPS